MLSDKSRPVIEATLPLVGSRIGAITPKFYARLFAAHPELLDGLFSRSNQRSGNQQQALAGSIAAFATHLVNNPGTLPETVLSRIAHRHASLGITEPQYQVVYEHLFAAIAEDLAEVITPEIAEAWTEVYWLMADALIKIEKGLYAIQANDKMWTPWRVASKTFAGTGAMTFTLEPADDTPITRALPGQYVSVKVQLPDGLRQVRQYSLSDDAGTGRTFTTKLDDDGEVSPVLHRGVGVGDILELSNPYGEITLKDGDGPVVLASAGIGCTPTASILRSLAESGSDRQVLVLHAESTLDSWALRGQMTDDVERLAGADLQLWLEEPRPGANEGFMSLREVDLPANASLYLCGPLPFMKHIRNEAINAGIPATRIHYEVFGPDIWLAS
ncbi:globin domain-containing protein [Pseudarthrobacter raffinosi]|uniref:globin domain-containing protein n=1 Tax=Pseudarthrobacter raffinosi TaxID=2953651 RepID=UPI00208F4D56|nr:MULTISPECIES: globin domain-containing protein [unclassified Pseudarthrobacter]MCO4237446.1 FAD-binding oxidoreductase [Pseudarthrobacter sp. MDT3-28]MCO4252457.1 FAD-binding oxidoreductase [Pseudarthrobacter sp. MDT3-9]MCO4262757.1 FAD-binding oxidoreductase [Pseudarthrobacter sp. MDT3-26]